MDRRPRVAQTVILAAGSGSRLASASGDVPKPLVTVAGVPLVAHALAHARASGCTEAVVVVGFDGDPQEFAAIKAGTEAATVVQYPAKIGEYGVQTLYKALKGETVPAFVDTGTGLATIENLAKFQ